MKSNRMLVKQELAFSKKCKNTSAKQKIIFHATFKAWPFPPDFNFACKKGQVTIATYKYYCPSVVNLTITKLQKIFSQMKQSLEIHHWKCCHTQKLVRFHVKTSLFSYYFKMLPFLSKVIVFFYVTFYSIMHLRWLLLVSCFYGSNQWFFKVKITCKRVNFIKK